MADADTLITLLNSEQVASWLGLLCGLALAIRSVLYGLSLFLKVFAAIMFWFGAKADMDTDIIENVGKAARRLDEIVVSIDKFIAKVGPASLPWVGGAHDASMKKRSK